MVRLWVANRLTSGLRVVCIESRAAEVADLSVSISRHLDRVVVPLKSSSERSKLSRRPRNQPPSQRPAPQRPSNAHLHRTIPTTPLGLPIRIRLTRTIPRDLPDRDALTALDEVAAAVQSVDEGDGVELGLEDDAGLIRRSRSTKQHSETSGVRMKPLTMG